MKKIRKILAFAIVAVFVLGMTTTTYAYNCTVTFHLDGGNVGGDTRDVVINVESEQLIPQEKIPTPVKDRCDFKEWYSFELYYDTPYTPVTMNEDFYPRWYEYYRPISGDESAFIIGSADDLVISWDAPFDYYSDEIVLTNLTTGKDVDLNNSDFSVDEGSTVLTLKNSFLATLDSGKYKVTLPFEYGEASATFTVKEATPVTPDTDADTDATTPDSTTPKTGDNSNIALFSLVGIVAASGIVSIVTIKKKTEEK